MNINDIMYILKRFELMIGHPCPAYLKNNDPDHNGDMFYQEYGDDPPEGVQIKDLDYWDESNLLGFRLIKTMWTVTYGVNEKEILILEFYVEGGCPNYMCRFKWPGTEEDFKYFIERYEELSTGHNHLLLVLYPLQFDYNV